MKKLLSLLLLLPLLSYGQQNNSTNTNFSNGLGASKFFNIPRGTTQPTTGILGGSLFFNTSQGLQYYDGTTWQTLGISGGGVTSFNARTGIVVPLVGDYSSFYPLLDGTGATGTWGIGITGNAGTVTNGVYTNGSYANPAWITSLALSKITDAQDSLTKKANRTFDNVAAGTIANVKLANSTLSGIELGQDLASHTAGYGLSGSSYNGGTARSWTADTTSASGLVSKGRLATNLEGYAKTTSLSGYVPTSRTLTINGTSQDLSASRTWTIAVTGTASRITVSGGTGLTPTIDISASYTGQTSITTLGTITTGVWNGTAIANANLANSSVTIGSTAISLGGTATTIAGLTSVTSTSFVGELTGNASTVTNGVYTVGNQTIGGEKTFSDFLTGAGIQSFGIGGVTSVDGSMGVFWDGSNSAGSGGHFILSENGGSNRNWLQQLNASYGMDFWYSSGGAYSLQASLSNTGVLTANSFVGPVTGNASTATALATTRTIWGQNFNGSANVTGAASGMTTLSLSGLITSTVTSGNLFTATSATTGGTIFQLGSSGASLLFGINNSTGSNVMTTGNYASYVFTHNATDLVFGTNDVARYTISATGGHDISGPLTGTYSSWSKGAKITGYDATAFSGSGPEMIYTGGTGIFQSYNRSGAVYLPTALDGSTLSLQISGVAAVSINSSQVATFSADPLVPDEAYGSGWNGSFEVPTKNAIYDAIQSGTYTPTLTPVSNITGDPTPRECRYIRVGNVVTVYGLLANLVPTGAGGGSVRISLPIASDFTVTFDLSGVSTSPSNLLSQLYMYANPTNNEAVLDFTAASSTTAGLYFTFSYTIL